MAKAGDKYGVWTLDSFVGRGGQGEVWRARAGEGQPRVAIKIVKVKKEKRRTRFVREVRAHWELSQAGHANILPILAHNLDELEAGCDYGYCVMPLAAKSLADAQRVLEGRLELTLEIIRGVATGVSHAHKEGIIHRDLKPANVLFLDEGLRDPQVSDFGICLLRADDERVTDLGETVGAKFFMAPEQERGGRVEVDPSADVYALGKILHFLYTGRNLHREKLGEAFRESELEREPRLPRVLSEILARSIVETPVERLKDAADFVAAIDAVLRRPVSGSRFPDSPVPRAVGEAVSDSSLGSVERPIYERLVRDQARGADGISRDISAEVRREWGATRAQYESQPEYAADAVRALVVGTPGLTAFAVAVARSKDATLYRPFRRLLESVLQVADAHHGYPAIESVPHVLAGFQYMVNCVAAVVFESWEILTAATTQRFEWYAQSKSPLFSLGFEMSHFFHPEAMQRSAPTTHDLYRGLLSNWVAEPLLDLAGDPATDAYVQTQMILSLRAAQETERGNETSIWPDFGRFYGMRVVPFLRRFENDDAVAEGLQKVFGEDRASFIASFPARIKWMSGRLGGRYSWDSLRSWPDGPGW